MFEHSLERSLEKEWLDQWEQHLTAAEYDDCLRKLFRINRWLNFYGDTVQILKQLPANASVLDVGCGDGLFALKLQKDLPYMKIKGIDIESAAIELAQQRLNEWHVDNQTILPEFRQETTKAILANQERFDAVISTLVCHHLSDAEIINFLQDTVAIAKRVVIINDLHRHPAASFLFKVIQPWLFSGKAIQHDGLLSIKRGFKDSDWQSLLKQAGIKSYQLQWRFPFRWRLIIWNEL